MRRTVFIQLLLLVATAFLLLFGAMWARSEAPRIRELRKKEIQGNLAGEAAVAQRGLAEIVDRTRDDQGEPPPLRIQRLKVRYLPQQQPPDLGRVFSLAERLEFVEKDPSAALDEYHRMLKQELLPTERIRALRNVARLGASMDGAADAPGALQEALRVEGASDHERLLAFYELAGQSEEDRQKLLAEIEEAGFPGVPPGRRAFIYEKLGGDMNRVPHLVAAAAVFSGDQPKDPAILPDETVSWLVETAGEWLDLALVPLDDLMGFLAPGWKDGRWDFTSDEKGVPLGKPFPSLRLDLGRASLEELDRIERSAFYRHFIMAAGPAVLLVAASALFLVTDLRKARLEKRKRDFLWSITHEFKTPLANILLYAETIHRHAPQDMDRTREFARTIGSEAQRLLQMVQQALDVAAGRSTELAKSERFDLRAVLEETVSEYRDAAANKSVDLSLSLPEEPAFLNATRNLAIRAVRGIVDNAFEFAASRVRVELEASADALAILVEDDGPGIPPADREAIFEPFVMLGGAETRKASGTGLGLTLVRQCVENDGGKVIASESSLGGAAFRIEYPRT